LGRGEQRRSSVDGRFDAVTNRKLFGDKSLRVGQGAVSNVTGPGHVGISNTRSGWQTSPNPRCHRRSTLLIANASNTYWKITCGCQQRHRACDTASTLSLGVEHKPLDLLAVAGLFPLQPPVAALLQLAHQLLGVGGGSGLPGPCQLPGRASATVV